MIELKGLRAEQFANHIRKGEQRARPISP